MGISSRREVNPPEQQTLFRHFKPFHALLKLRLRDKDRILWINALVINQSDLAERATEVAKLSAIFSKAIKTLVWLGQGNSRIEADMVTLANCNVEKGKSDFPSWRHWTTDKTRC